jgi:acetylglutamate kinase
VKSPELQASMIHDLILLSYGGLRTIIVFGHIPVIAVVAADDGKTQA